MTTNAEIIRRERFLSRCIHYTGPWDATHCAAGVEIDKVVDRSVRPYRRPCSHPDAATSCPKRELPTEADFEAWTREFAEGLKRMAKIRAAILETGQQQGRIDCPCCGEVVGFSVASNGHVAASCSTKGCAKWVE